MPGRSKPNRPMELDAFAHDIQLHKFVVDDLCRPRGLSTAGSFVTEGLNFLTINTVQGQT